MGCCRTFESRVGFQYTGFLIFPYHIQNCEHFSFFRIAERANRTIKEQLFKYMTANSTKRYIDALQDIVAAYNERIHSATKFAPKDVKMSNMHKVMRNLFPNFPYDSEEKVLPVGTIVRKVEQRNAFSKGYKGYFTPELYEIIKVHPQTTPARYSIRELKEPRHEIGGRWYAKELFPIPTYPPTYDSKIVK